MSEQVFVRVQVRPGPAEKLEALIQKIDGACSVLSTMHHALVDLQEDIDEPGLWAAREMVRLAGEDAEKLQAEIGKGSEAAPERQEPDEAAAPVKSDSKRVVAILASADTLLQNGCESRGGHISDQATIAVQALVREAIDSLGGYDD